MVSGRASASVKALGRDQAPYFPEGLAKSIAREFEFSSKEECMQ